MTDFSQPSGAAASPLPDLMLSEVMGEPRARDLDIAERLAFDRPRKIRDLIKANVAELGTLGPTPRIGAMVGIGSGAQREVLEYWLNEEQALLIATLSSAPNAPAVRAMLIRTFVAWRRGQLVPATSDGVVTELSPAVRAALGGIVKGIVHKELAEAVTSICTTVLPAMLTSALAQHNLMVRRGNTAGQILREAGFPPVKGMAGWFGNRLATLGYGIEGDGRCEQGDRTARMFDPDKVGVWLRAGGRVTVEQKIAARRGQKVIHLVAPVSEATRVF